MKRAATRAGTLVGLVVLLCGLMGFVLLGTGGTWHSELQVPAGRTAIVVGPSLASVIGPQISVHVSSDGARVPLFVGHARPDDASAFVETSDHLVLTGLDGARQIASERRHGNDPLTPPATADIWHSSVTGSGSVTLRYHAAVGAESAVVARTDGKPLPAMSVRLGWSNRTWYWVPLVLVVAGAALLVGVRRWGRPDDVRRRSMSPLARRRMRERARAAAARASEGPGVRDAADPTSGGRAAKKPAHVGRRRAEPTRGRRR